MLKERQKKFGIQKKNSEKIPELQAAATEAPWSINNFEVIRICFSVTSMRFITEIKQQVPTELSTTDL